MAVRKVSKPAAATEPAPAPAKPRPLPPNAGKGRPKGSMNASTKEMKEVLRGAFEELGGQAFLVKTAKKNPGLFFAMLNKLIPSAVEGSFEGNVTYIIHTGVPRDGAGDGED